MSSIQSIETPQDYVNYTFNLTTRGVTEVTSELTGMSSTVSNLVGLMAFKTSEYLSNTEAMLVGFGYAAAATFTTATQQAIRFEQALADVKAIGGETTDALAIGQAAMKYSNQFGMNVDAMTEGLEALSRAGLTATNVMSGILEEGVKLSKLEGMDLEDSINNLISTTNLLAEGGYDVNSQDYAEMVKAMNQHIVSTSESAPINAQNIIQTLQHVGGYASANKIDQDDLFAVIAQLGSKGTKGEMAGTALRAFIAAGQKDQAQRALKRIGLEPADLWDNTGEAMLPISEMKAILDDALETRGYSQQEKLEFYADFAGYKQANQIMKINVDEVQNYKENIAQAWDLGTKLETILGTVHSNIQIISQTVKNFMTRVGNTMLPILNAVLQPIKWVVQLIDAMPFSEQIVGMGLTFLALKGLFVGVNRVVPAIASLYTSFTRQEKQVKSIKGHFKNLLNDAKEFKETIEHIKDPEWNATKRMQNDKSGMGAVEYSRAVAQIMYDSLKGKDITGKAYDELSKYEQNNFIELVASLGQDKELYQSIVSQIDKRSLALRDAIINLQSLPTEEVTIDIPSKSGTSKRDINSKITQQRAGMQEQSNEAKKGNQLNEQNIKVLKDTYKDIQGLKQYIMSHTDTGTNQYDIGRGIMSIAHPFSEILANAFFKRKDTKEFDTKAGSISFDSQIGVQATNELNNIFEDVQNNISNLPDISFYYDNDVGKMQEQAQILANDIANVAKIFSNVNIDDMHWYQGVRALKAVDIQAMGQIGINYSEMMNEAYIREVLKQENFDKNNKFIENIYDEQVELLAESLNVDISKISNKVDKIEAVYNAFKSKENTKSISEVVSSSTQWYHDSLDERIRPSENAAKWLNDDAAKYIMDMLNISYDNTKTNMSEQLQNHFINKDITMETRWMVRQLAFALQKGQTSDIYSGPESAELKYMIEHLAALNQSIKRLTIPNLTELAEILYELGPEDFERHKKDILTGRAFIKTPARIRNETYYDEDELKEAYDIGDINDAEYKDGIRQLHLTPDEINMINGLDRHPGFDVMNINEDADNPYADEDEIIESLQDIKKAIEGFDLTPITTILTDIKNIIDKPQEPPSSVPILSPNGQPPNVSITINGDVIFNGDHSSNPIINDIIDINGRSTDAIESSDNNAVITPPSIKPTTNDDIYEAAALSVTAMLTTFVDNVEFEINSLRKFISTFLLFKKGVEIIERNIDQEEKRAQDVMDDFDALTQGINNQWTTLGVLIKSLFETLQQQEEEKEELNSIIKELITNTRNFSQYLGNILVTEEDVSDELAQYIKDGVKNIIDETLNPPEKLVNIPKSNNTINQLREDNKEDRKKGWRNPTPEKDSGDEVVIGSYRVPMDDKFPDVPSNLMVRGYPQSVKDQLHENAINRMAKQDTDAQAQRAARAKAKSDGEAAAKDLLNMAHSMHVEASKKHAINPDSLTDDELDFIGLNKERDNKRKKKRYDEVTDEDLEKARTGVAWTEYEKSKAEKNKENQKRLSQGATNEDVKLGHKKPSLDDIYGTPSQYEEPIGPKPYKPSGKEMAAKVLGKTIDEIDEMEENRKLQQLIAFVDKTLVDEEEPYIPSMVQEGVGTAISQGKRMHEFVESYTELLFVASNIQQEINKEKEKELNALKEQQDQAKKNIEQTQEKIKIDELRRKFETGLYELTDEELELIGEGEHSTKPNSKVRADALQAKRQKEQEEENIKNAQENAARISGLYDVEEPNEEDAELERDKHTISPPIRAGFSHKKGTQKSNADNADEFWDEIDTLEEEGNNEYQQKIKEQQERVHAQQQEMQIQAIEAQTELLNIAKNIAEEEERKTEERAAKEDLKYLFGEESLEHKQQRHSQRLQELENKDSLTSEEKIEKLGLKGKSFLSDLLIKPANKLPEDTYRLKYSNKFADTADKIDTMVAPLHRLNDALFRAGEIFPPLTIAAYGLEGALSLVTMVTDGLRFAQEAYAFVAGLLGLAIDEEAASTGVLTAAKYGNIIANWLETGAEEQNAAAKLIGAGITWIQAGAEALLNAIRVIGMGPLLLIIAAVAALIAIVYVSEQNHANALKESQKALEKSNQSMKSAIANYKSMRSARLGEQDATRKHMAALKESIALKKLETDRSKRLMDIDKNTKLKNDSTWGEYGLRAQFQKSRGWLSLLGGAGVLLDASAGEYKNTSEDHEGTSGQIRAILDSESAFGLFNSQYQNYVDTYYKQHAYDFGRMDQFAPQLQDLYGLETQLQRAYGTEGARDSEEFRRAVQEMANETGLSGEVIGQYLDQMQVEANVEYARTNAQSEFGRIQADASAAAMKVLYPETGNMNDQEALQYNMIMSAVNDEAYKAKRELFMNAIMEYVQAIVAVLTGDWGNIDNHINAGNEYIKGVGQINENQQRIAEESLEVGKANLRKDYGTKSYSFYGDTPFGGAVEAAHSMGMSVPSSGGAQSSNPISTQSNNSAGTSASTSASSQTALNTAHKSLNSASEALDATTTAPTSTDNQATGLGDIASGIVNKALDFAKHYDPIVAVIDSIFSDDNSNTSGTSQPNVNKYEININTININTEDDPTKIKTAFMNLMIEMSEQITPRQVSRTVGSTSNQNTNATTEGVDVNINNNNNNNANPTL